MPYPVEELQNSADELSITSFSQPNKGKISCNDLSLTKDTKLTASKKRPASKISVGSSSKKRPASKISVGASSKKRPASKISVGGSSKDSKNKKVYRGE